MQRREKWRTRCGPTGLDGSSIVGLPFHPTWTHKEMDVRGRGARGGGEEAREKAMEAWAFGLTSWAASEDQLTDFIIDKDEQGVREGAEPPVGPGEGKKKKKKG